MTFASIFAFCTVSLLSLCALSAQGPSAPMGLSASYKRYVNRIELTWQVSSAKHRYAVQRREKTSKSFVSIDTVAQNRYVDRKKLRGNTDYVYRVQSMDDNGAVSLPSNEAVGALMAVADGHETDMDPIPLEHCVQVQFETATLNNKVCAAKIQANTPCAFSPTLQLSLFLSRDVNLDETDIFLSSQRFDPARKRAALSTKNKWGHFQGYFLLRVEANGQTYLVSKQVP
jgi:hypothetical protein